MSTMQQREPQDQVSGWAIGGIAFAGTMMVLIGVFQALAGLVAIFNDEFYVVARNYTFDLDVTAWGWIHLLVGIAVLATGMLSALVNFFFIPYYPIWSLLEIGLAIWVIWALTRPGAIET
jgi:hypothetical protein